MLGIRHGALLPSKLDLDVSDLFDPQHSSISAQSHLPNSSLASDAAQRSSDSDQSRLASDSDSDDGFAERLHTLLRFYRTVRRRLRTSLSASTRPRLQHTRLSIPSHRTVSRTVAESSYETTLPLTTTSFDSSIRNPLQIPNNPTRIRIDNSEISQPDIGYPTTTDTSQTSSMMSGSEPHRRRGIFRRGRDFIRRNFVLNAHRIDVASEYVQPEPRSHHPRYYRQEYATFTISPINEYEYEYEYEQEDEDINGHDSPMQAFMNGQEDRSPSLHPSRALSIHSEDSSNILNRYGSLGRNRGHSDLPVIGEHPSMLTVDLKSLDLSKEESSPSQTGKTRFSRAQGRALDVYKMLGTFETDSKNEDYNTDLDINLDSKQQTPEIDTGNNLDILQDPILVSPYRTSYLRMALNS